MNKNLNFEFGLDMGALSKRTFDNDELIANLVAGGELFNDWNFIEGNTYKKPIHIVDTNAALTKGTCPTTAGGTVSFSDRDITVAQLNDRTELCIDDLKQYWTGVKYQGKGAQYDGLEFADIILNDKLAKIGKEKERIAFVGDGNNANEIDGLLVIAGGETASLNHYATYSGMTAGNAVTVVDGLIEEHIDGNPDIASAPTYLYMGYSQAFLLSSKLIAEYGDFLNREKDFMAGEFIRFAYPKLPNVIIIGTHALQANGSLFMTNVENLYHSGDLVGDSDMIHTEANAFHQKFLMLVKFQFGVNYAFPGNVSYLKKA